MAFHEYQYGIILTDAVCQNSDPVPDLTCIMGILQNRSTFLLHTSSCRVVAKGRKLEKVNSFSCLNAGEKLF